MAAYGIAHRRQVDVSPPIVESLRRIDATLRPFGGRCIVHGGKVEVLEGSWPGTAIVIAFPDLAAARGWYRSAASDGSRSGKPPRDAFSDDVRLHHPFLSGSLQGPEACARLWCELERAAGPVTFTHRFDTAGALDDPNKPWPDATAGLGNAPLERLVWNATSQDKPLQGMTIAKIEGDRFAEVRVLLRPLPTVQKLRDAVRARTGDERAPDLWGVPVGTDTTVPSFDPSAEVDPHFPVPMSEDVVVHTPVTPKAVRGTALVTQVIGHATATYGGRTYGPRLMSGRQALTTWVGAVAGLTLHTAHLSTFDEQGRMHDLVIFMRPVPTVEGFSSHLLPRIQGLLGPEFFDASE
jgi:uncharacterized protein (DUF1330 family)